MGCALPAGEGPEDEAALEAAILAAHARDDRAALARLYARGAALFLDRGAADHGLFLMTQAYIFALDAGLDAAADYHAVLKAHGREA